MNTLKLDRPTIPPKSSSSMSMSDAERVGKRPNLDQASKGFEALFVQTMLKEMHNAKLEDGLFDSDGEKPFQSMLDGAYADLATKQSHFGIAEAINRSFSKFVQDGTAKS